MEPLSTFNLDASFAQPSETARLKDLATKARQLVNQRGNGTRIQFTGTNSLNSRDTNAELMEVAQKFEAILIHQMLKAMRKTVHKSDLINSFSLEQYESMLDEEIANEMAKHKGIGLADNLFYQLSRLENAANPATSVSNKTPGVNNHE